MAATSMDEIAGRVEKPGYGVIRPEPAGELSFGVRGLHCASCVGRLEKRLLENPAVSAATVNLAAETGFVRFDPRRLGMADIFAMVHEAGYTPVELQGTEASA